MKLIFKPFKFLWLCVFGRDKSKIPKDTLYCYTVVESDESLMKRQIKTCPYYFNFTKNSDGCSYNRFMGFDILLFDQCKICEVGIPHEITQDDQ